MATDEQIEQEIQDKGLTAPRVTLASLEDKILTEQYHVFPGTTVTVCALTLKNGFSVVGHSASASAENFDEAIGRKIARQKAVDEMWALEGYLLREYLSDKKVYFVPDPLAKTGWRKVNEEEYKQIQEGK